MQPLEQHRVEVKQVIEVSVDETKFTPGFMTTFKATMYPFDSVNRHIEHLAQLYARGIVDNHSFIEGYGWASEFGIKFRQLNQEVEIE